MTQAQARILETNRNIVNVYEHTLGNWVAKLTLGAGLTAVSISSDNFELIHVLLRVNIKALKGVK